MQRVAYALWGLCVRAARVSWTCVLSGVIAAAHGAEGARALSLEAAWQLAEQNNPALRAAIVGRGALEGQRREAGAVLWSNPELSVSRSRRLIPGQPALEAPGEINQEWEFGVSQSIELRGQRRFRLASSEEDLAAHDAAIREQRSQLRSEVETRFVQVLALQRRIEAERGALALIEQAAVIAGRRVEAGEDSRLDGNLAAIEAERARSQIATLDELLVQARADLGTLLQLPPEQLPATMGAVAPGERSYTLTQLVESAGRRPVLAALEHREQAARHRLDLERAAATPDLTVGLNVGREGAPEARERIYGISLSVPLPFFKRNDAAIARASTELTQTRIGREAAQRDARALVLALWERVQLVESRYGRLRSGVLPRLEENRRLSTRAFQEGEIGLVQLLLVNRQLLDGQRELLEAETDLRLTRVALEREAGWNAAGLGQGH